jgi:hypothetical protein
MRKSLPRRPARGFSIVRPSVTVTVTFAHRPMPLPYDPALALADQIAASRSLVGFDVHPGTSAGSMTPCRRQPIRSNHVRAGAISLVSAGSGGPVSTRQPSNQRPELAGSSAARRCTEALHAARDRVLVLGFVEQMRVIALNRVVHDPEAVARTCLTESHAETAHEAWLAQRRQAAEHTDRHVLRRMRIDRCATPVQHAVACRTAGRRRGLVRHDPSDDAPSRA